MRTVRKIGKTPENHGESAPKGLFAVLSHDSNIALGCYCKNKTRC
jgi:hypothetical protein